MCVSRGIGSNSNLWKKYPQQHYPFNYTLSSSFLVNRQRLEQHGMASFYDPLLKQFRTFKSSAIQSPSQKILIAEELMLYDEHPVRQSVLYSELSSGWEWPVDEITHRHSGRGNVTFPDGHSEAVFPSFGKMKEHYQPDE